ncbi:hypothetical protein MC885_014261 [Smutsia gigantea]|nr:hypothetical protein MC885_014261 [Smutsia gigantea]
MCVPCRGADPDLPHVRQFPPNDSCVCLLSPDEIMHQDITPLCAADIQDQLRKRFAYLSGECRGWGSGEGLHASSWPLLGSLRRKQTC